MRFRQATDKEIADRVRLWGNKLKRLPATELAREGRSVADDLIELVTQGIEVRDLFDDPGLPEGVRVEGLSPANTWKPLTVRPLNDQESKALKAPKGSKAAVVETMGWKVASNATVRIVYTALSALNDAHELARRIVAGGYLRIKVLSQADANAEDLVRV